MTLVTVATCQLNQWAMDFDGNMERIWESCVEAKKQGASYRLGPELEFCGYGCEDHFLELDTIDHCWESLVELMKRGVSDGLLCDFGLPLLHCGVRYNARVLAYNGRILWIRPKQHLADNGNYRESRYFTPWSSDGHETKFLLPTVVQKSFPDHPRYVPMGSGYMESTLCGMTIGCESCEELWTPQSTHIGLALQGVDIVGNGSGSHHELRKLNARLELMVHATRKCGGIYLYANQRGCDGSRLYWDGCSMICANGQVLAQAPQFDVREVVVISATVDVDDVRSYRASIPSWSLQAQHQQQQQNDSGSPNGVVSVDDLDLAAPRSTTPTLPLKNQLSCHTPEEECCLGPACWLWDYLRRSGAAGYFLPLSGGADSSSVAAIVGVMCRIVTEAAKKDEKVASDLRRVCRKDDDKWIPDSPQEVADCVLHTAFMGTENSSQLTESRARRLAEQIGAYHFTNVKIDAMVKAVLQVFTATTGKTPSFTSQGGTMTEDLALQNIQARLRMVTAYLFAQLLPWIRGRSGFLLVLGSANVDEGLRGYMTKYDCSSADLNPIGAISKNDLKRMLLWASQHFAVLEEIAGAPPTAELRPIADNGGKEEHTQLDEEEMGMTYEELGWYGRLRKIARCGPVSMYRKLAVTWDHLAPTQVAAKVKRFFFYYAINRHKMCTVTPAYHAEAYSPDDNRFDLRQFLYNPKWSRQFSTIDRIAKQQEEETKKEE